MLYLMVEVSRITGIRSKKNKKSRAQSPNRSRDFGKENIEMSFLIVSEVNKDSKYRNDRREIFNAKIVRGTGWVEGIEFHGQKNPLALAGQAGRQRGTGGSPCLPAGQDKKEDFDRKEANRERAARRAKTTLRRKAKELYGKTGGNVYMLTLTYAENMQDYDRAVRDMRLFLLRVWRYAGRKLFYIAVPERQERGAWHWHILIDLRLEHKEWERLWGHGFIWVTWVHSCRAAARYVAKYITKAYDEEFGVPEGRHRYLTAQGLGEWEVQYKVVTDELGTWFGFEDKDGFKILGVMSIPGEVAWWEAMLDELDNELKRCKECRKKTKSYGE
jgi:hypothetical protein